MSGSRPIHSGLIGAVLLAAGCGSNSSSGSGSSSGGGSSAGAAGPAKTGTVSLEIGSPVTSLEPAKGISFRDFIVAQALYDPLVAFNEAGKVIWTWPRAGPRPPTRRHSTSGPGRPAATEPSWQRPTWPAFFQRYMDPAAAAPR